MISAILFRRGWCEDPPHKKIRTSRNGNRANSAQGGRNPTCKLQNHVHYFYSYVFLLADIPQIAVDFSLILPPFPSRDKESRCAWKRIQYCYADRIVLIEAWFRGEHPDNIAVAVIHAHHFCHVPLTDMRLVNIGSGEVAKGTTASQLNRLRSVSPTLILSIFDMMFATQSIWAHLMVERLIGAKNIMRIDVPPGYQHEFELDDAEKALQALPGLAEAVARNNVGSLNQFLR
jgi:hypothetical protein